MRARGARRDARAGRVGEPSCVVEEPDKVLLVGFKNRGAEAADRQDPGRGRAAARQVARGDGDRPGRRGRQPGPGRLFPDVARRMSRREVGPAVDELRLRRGGAGARGRVPEVQHPPARLRQFRAAARQVCARRKARAAAGGGAAADRRCPPTISGIAGSRARSSPATSPTSSCSTPRRSATTRPSRSRSSTPTGMRARVRQRRRRCCRTASTPAPRPAASCAAPAGSAAPRSQYNPRPPHNARRRGRGGFGRGGRRRR